MFFFCFVLLSRLQNRSHPAEEMKVEAVPVTSLVDNHPVPSATRPSESTGVGVIISPWRMNLKKPAAR